MKITLPIFVVAFETDYGGVVSNTRYVEYLERGRYALLRASALNLTQIARQHGITPIVRRTAVDYLIPAQHEDELELSAWVAEHAGATTTLRFELIRPRDGAIIMRGEQILAYLNTRWKPVRVPALFRDVLAVESRDERS